MATVLRPQSYHFCSYSYLYCINSWRLFINSIIWRKVSWALYELSMYIFSQISYSFCSIAQVLKCYTNNVNLVTGFSPPPPPKFQYIYYIHIKSWDLFFVKIKMAVPS